MDKKLNVIITDSDATMRNILKNYLKNIDGAELCAEFDSPQDCIDKAKNTPDCVLIIDLAAENALQTISLIHQSARQVRIIALSDLTTTSSIIRALRAGAIEYLTKPVTETAFCALIRGFVENDGDVSTNSCKVISTFSNKGGIGKTSIAVNTAVEIADMTKEKVALIDLNLQLGDVSTFLDLNPGFDIAYIAKNLDNMDDSELIQSLSQYKNSTLYVVADPINIEKSKEITSEQIDALIKRLKKIFSYIIIDVSTSIDAKSIKALDISDVILLVAVVNLPAVRNLQRCMNMFEKLGYSREKIKLVLNRYMENEEIKTSDIEDVVKQKVYWKIPNNYLTMMSAVNKGAPVSRINPDSNIAINYKEFASKLCDYLITSRLQNK